MPPRFTSLPQVGENQSPNARMAPVPQGTFDTRQAQQNLEIVRQEQEKIDFYDNVAAETALKDKERQSNYQAVLGENARELPKRMEQEYDKWISEISDTLKSERQRAIFQQRAGRNRVAFLESVENHSLRQKTISEAQKTDAYVATWNDAGIRAGASGNYSEMDRSAEQIDHVRRIWGEANGVNKDVVDRMIAEDTNKTYVGAIKAMLDSGNDQGAKAALAKYGDKILERDRAKLAGMVQNESTLGAAQREVDKIFTNYVEWETQEEHQIPASEEAAMEEARKIKDKDVRAAAERLTRERWAGLERSAADERKKLMVDAANQIDGGKTFEQLPATLRDSLTPTERKQLRTYAKGEIQTDDATWYSLMLMASNEGTREQFKRENLMKHLDKLSRSDFQEIAKLQAEVIKGKTKEADGFRSVEGIVSGTIKDAIKDDGDRERFMRVMNKEVKAWRASNPGKEIPDEEVERLTDTMLKKVITDPNYLFFFTGRDPLYKAVSEDDVKANEKSADIMRKMKMEDRSRIVNDLKMRGIAVTDANILRFYGALKADEARAKNVGK